MNDDMKELAKKLLTTSTGKHFLDSGDYYGRHWEYNRKVDFDNQPTAWVDYLDVGQDIIPTVSLYHWLITRFELDDLCKEYNSLPCKDWDSNFAHGVSKNREEWLKRNGFEMDYTFNSVNGECDLSQVIQGARLYHEDSIYYLIQIHNGCDVRGGYTKAALLKPIDDDYVTVTGNVMGILTREGAQIMIDNGYNGYSLTNQRGEPIIYQANDQIEVWLYDI